MIQGVVNSRLEAVVQIRLRGPGHSGLDLDAIVDSGFNGSLALPNSTIVALGLTKLSSGGTTLADGLTRQFDIYQAEVEWKDGWRTVLVSVVGDELLLGMQLLEAHEPRISVVQGGAVKITPLP